MRISPTQRTLALLRSEGMLCEIVERWNPHARCRQDLFGFADIIALNPAELCWGCGIWAIQCTSSANMAARITKIKTECRENAMRWVIAYGRIQVIGWAKRGPRGARKVWTCNRTLITLEDLRDAAETP